MIIMERKCMRCDFIGKSIEGWYAHLLTPMHQEIAGDNFPPHGKWSRTIVGWELDDTLATYPERIIGLFTKTGVIEDIYFRKVGRDFSDISACYVLMENRKVAEAFVDKWNSTCEVRIDGKKGLVEVRQAIFDILKYMQWKDWCREVVQYEKTYLSDLRHDALIAKLSEVPPNQQLELFMQELTLSKVDEDLRIQTIEHLSRFIRRWFPSSQLYPFGSYLTGLSNPDSDIDIFVDLREDMHLNRSTKEDVMQHLYKEFLRAADCDFLKDRSKKQFKDVVYIKHARIPIIRVVNKKTNIKLDLSFNSAISLHNSRLIKFYLDFDPLVKPLMMLLRYWATSNDLVDSMKIKSYGLNLMTIVFLNQKRVLPRVAYLQKLDGYKRIEVEGCNVSFCENVDYVKESIEELKSQAPNVADLQAIMSLAMEFFCFYGSEDLDENFICTLHGTLVNKTLLTQDDILEEYLGSKVDISRLYAGPLVIQDPFVLDVNVNSPNRSLVARFQRLCKQTDHILRKKMNSPDHTLTLTDLLIY